MATGNYVRVVIKSVWVGVCGPTVAGEAARFGLWGAHACVDERHHVFCKKWNVMPRLAINIYLMPRMYELGGLITYARQLLECFDGCGWLHAHAARRDAMLQ